MKPASTRLSACLARSLAAATVLALAACAASPLPPTDQLTRAESAIKRAEEARVADYASPELTSAREKLASARDAVNREDMELAGRLADQARVDAEVATAKTEAAKAKANITEMQKANTAIQQESQRNVGGSTPIILPAPPAPPAQPTQPSKTP